MNEKKHIDKIFQEKLKDFSVSPDDTVWKDIENTLKPKKKKRRVIPIWWRVAGIAAGLIFAVFIAKSLISPNTDVKQNTLKTVDTPKKIIQQKENEQQQNISPNIPVENNVASTKANDSNNKDGNSNTEETTARVAKKVFQKNNSISNHEKVAVTINKDEISNKNVITNNPQKTLNNNSSDPRKIEETVAISSVKEKVINREDENLELLNSEEVNKIIEDTKNSKVVSKSSEIVKEDSEKTEKKLSIYDEIATKDTEEKDINEEEKLNSRWSVAPNIAPVYFNSLGKGSSIDNRFVDNTKSGDINVSYGVKASYNLSNKLAVRTGVNNLKVGYSTKDVVMYAYLPSSSSSQDRIPANLDHHSSISNFNISSVTEFQSLNTPSSLVNNIDTTIEQELTFFEVPVEIAYKISDKKIGVNLIGGVSALFLNDNVVYSKYDDRNILLGKANNINNTSFSANLGVGFNMKILEKVDITLEPVFKYQINTFKNTSGDFNPYVVGVYSGLSFKF